MKVEEVVTEPEQFGSITNYSNVLHALKDSGREIPCQIMWSDDPGDIGLRFLLGDDDELSLIRDRLDNFFKMIGTDKKVIEPTLRSIPRSNLNIGLPVAVYEKKESTFYRAFVVKFNTQSCWCYLIDIGSTEVFDLECVNYLPKDLMLIDGLVVHAKLSGLTLQEHHTKHIEQFRSSLFRLSGSYDLQVLKENPLMCTVVDVADPPIVEYESAWRFHSHFLAKITVELRLSKSSYAIGCAQNGLASLLASADVCSIISTKTTDEHFSYDWCDMSKIIRDKDIGKGRGRRFRHLPLSLCPPVPFDSDSEEQ